MPTSRTAALTLLMALAAAAVDAQTNSSIAGTVTDATGAVLPGVTVEVTSPALIEKVRTAITDASGQYQVVELRPGVYTVTFALPGFATVKREGVELTTGFTATVNGELRVGAVEETVTVSGQSPVVDVQNVQQQHVMTRDVIDAIPTARNFANLGTLIPGTTLYGYGRALDVGGSFGHANQMLMIHGSRSTDQQPLVDGMFVGFIGFGFMTFALPDANTEEINIETVAHSAETETGGVRVNMVPRSGGNLFTGSGYYSYTNHHLQSDNLDDGLRSSGLTAVTSTNYLSDFSASAGGPIARDKLWVYAGGRDWRTHGFGIARFDADNRDFVYTPDTGRRPAPLDKDSWNGTARLTWQASRRDKISANLIYDYLCHCTQAFSGTFEALTMPEADQTADYFNRIGQVTWVRPATSRLLFEGGFSYTFNTLDERAVSTAIAPPALELSTGLSFRARSGAPGLNELFPLILSKVYVGRASMSYVTGSHALKVGVALNPGTYHLHRRSVGDYLVVLLNGSPVQAQFYTTPYDERARWNKVALFAQDQWRLRRFTLNLGVRFDRHTSTYDEARLPATAYLPARSFPEEDVLSWKDVSPRLGVSYDIFGNGRTALKVSLARYLATESYGLANSVSPAVTSTGRLARTWSDANGDFVPQGDPRNPLPNGELVGPSPNASWGQPVNTLTDDPEWRKGWGKRGYNWEVNAGIQHELFPRVSVSASYDRRRYGNFTVIDNLAVSPADYDPYCITAPSDERLPGGGGQRICGLYDVTPSKAGAFNRYRTLASNYGDQYEYWHGVDFLVNARLQQGIILQGGLDTGKRVTDNCDVVTKVDNPSTLYCHAETPFWAPSVKFLTSYPLPGRFVAAATFQRIPGYGDSTNPNVQAIYVARNAQIAPVLGRDLAAGPNGTVSVNLIPPGSEASDTVHQLDLRVSRQFTWRASRIRASFDLYNALNANPVTQWNQTYGTTGAAWMTPTAILPGRLGKFSVQVDF